MTLIVRDLSELDLDAQSIVAKGREHFLGDQGRLDRHAADGILVKVQELCDRLPESFRDEHPSVPWNEIRGLRNRIGHNYRATDHRTVWVTISESLSELVAAIR